jgi:predicted nucleic acid-binding Zn ribbon protein
MKCVVCDTPLINKRKDAKYCSSHCKWEANKNTEASKNYIISLRGRALAMWHNSKSRDKIHSISVDWIENKLKIGICEKTGIPFDFIYGKGRTAFAPSLDKIVPSLGYTQENTQVVVWIYNTAKNIFTDGDVLYMAKCLLNKTAGNI